MNRLWINRNEPSNRLVIESSVEIMPTEAIWRSATRREWFVWQLLGHRYSRLDTIAIAVVALCIREFIR